MAINKKLIHFNTFENFNSKKLSANKENTQYTLGVNGSIMIGEPEILYQSIVYIKDIQLQWTHGLLYNCNTIELVSPNNNGLMPSTMLGVNVDLTNLNNYLNIEHNYLNQYLLIPYATPHSGGVMSSLDKAKVNEIENIKTISENAYNIALRASATTKQHYINVDSLPIDAQEGDIAFVGDTFPGILYEYVNEEWTATGKEASTNIILTDYVTKVEYERTKPIYLTLQEYDALVASGQIDDEIEYNIYEE